MKTNNEDRIPTFLVGTSVEKELSELVEKERVDFNAFVLESILIAKEYREKNILYFL